MNKRGFFSGIKGFIYLFIIILVLFFAVKLISVYYSQDSTDKEPASFINVTVIGAPPAVPSNSTVESDSSSYSITEIK